MKVALINNELLIKDMNPLQFNVIKSWNRMTYKRKEQMMVGVADLELLTLLSQLVPLTPKLEAARKNLQSVQDAIDAERNNQHPVPFLPMPIKVKPFAHQVRGYNMALLALGLIKKE